MVSTYRVNFKKAKDTPFYIKEQFEVTPYCNSRYNSNDHNMLSRLQNTLATAINESQRLPKFIICVLNNDLINFLKFNNIGMSPLIGEMLKWLVKEFNEIISLCKSQLPAKAVREDHPQFYWTVAPIHMHFDENEALIRKKYNLCLQSLLKKEPNMRAIKLKEFWDPQEMSLVSI